MLESNARETVGRGNDVVSVVVPSHNEPTTGQVVDRLCALPIPIGEVIVVDDGSNAPIGDFPTYRNVRVIRHPRRLGKGAAVRTGIAAATGSIIVVQDADLEYAPEDIPKLVAPIHLGVADVVLGSRYLDSVQGGWRGYRLNRAGGAILTRLINGIHRTALTDVTTGHKAFRSDFLKQTRTKDEGFAWDVSVLVQLSRQRCLFSEVPIGYAPRRYEDGKKVGWVDFFRSAYAIVRDSVQ